MLRIALVQYDPKFGQVDSNIAYVDKMIQHLTPELVDIILLPEMAFTGYMFESREDIEPYLESENGTSARWAKATATRLACYVIVGFPEKDFASGQAYNSLAIVESTGSLQTIYRKHFLYDTDKKWAVEGPAFSAFSLNTRRQKQPIITAPAICMDLNPKDFVAPFDAFEFANFAKDSKAKLVICSMNWLASSPPEEDKHAQDSDTAPGGHRTELSNDAWEEVSDTLSYWATRLSPLIGTDALFIGCNRVGVEKGTAFTGSSCVMQLSKAPEVLAFAGKREERVLMARAVVQS